MSKALLIRLPDEQEFTDWMVDEDHWNDYDLEQDRNLDDDEILLKLAIRWNYPVIVPELADLLGQMDDQVGKSIKCFEWGISHLSYAMYGSSIDDLTEYYTSEEKARLYFWELLIYRLYLDLTEPTERFKGEEQLLDLGFEFKPSASVSPDVYTLLDTSWEVHIEYMPTITDFRAILRPQVFLNGSLVQVFDRWLDNNLSNLIKFLKANAPVKQVER